MPPPKPPRGKKTPLTLRQKALRALARRDYSRAELARKLKPARSSGRTIDDDLEADGGDAGEGFVGVSGKRERDRAGDIGVGALDKLLDEFEASGWLSDTRFAGSAARQRQGRFSQRHIVEDLKSKGVASETAQTAVAALEQDDEATAMALWRQRFGKAPVDQKEKARQVRFLQSRGFSLSLTFKLLKRAGAAVDDTDDLDHEG